MLILIGLEDDALGCTRRSELLFIDADDTLDLRRPIKTVYVGLLYQTAYRTNVWVREP